MAKTTLWTKNYTLLTVATILGAAGAVAGNFALSFLVFDETGSPFAAALIFAIQVIPGFLVPLIAAPWMDRLPRKPFLVLGDAINGAFYILGGLWLMFFPFSYLGYLAFSLLLTSLSSFDRLAFNSLYPMLIPAGMEQKGYAIAGILYPVLEVVMMPLAAVLLDTIGVAWILILQGALSLLAAFTENFIRIKEENRLHEDAPSLKLWARDIKEAVRYLKGERGLRSIYSYCAFSGGMMMGYTPVLVAFFRTAAGMTTAMYSLFTVAEFAGRALGGVLHYNINIPPKKRFGFVFSVYNTYDSMDACLLWLPYPLMLVNRALCGFLATNSATLRQTAVQQYIPEALRARINAFEGMINLAVSSVLALIVGAIAEMIDYRLCMTLCGAASLAFCWLIIFRNRKDVSQIYLTQKTAVETE